MTVDASTCPSPDDFLEQLSGLHGALSEGDFLGQLETVLGNLADCRDYSVIWRRGPELRVLYSSGLKALRSRLSAPTLDANEFSALQDKLADLDADSAPLTIDGQLRPVHHVWPLGLAGSNVGCLLFHQPELNMPAICEKDLHGNISAAFHKLQEIVGLREDSDRLQAKLDAINDIGELLGSLDLEVLLTKLLELSLYLAGGQVGSIVLDRPSQNTGDGDESGDATFECPIEWGLPLEILESFQTRDGVPIFREVVARGREVAVPDFSSTEDYALASDSVHVDSYLCIPLMSKNRVLGAVNIVNCVYQEKDRDILSTICGLAATSIENAMLYEDSVEKERYQESLKIARDIQRRLYPSESPAIEWLDIAARTESCDETGGDYFDFIVSGESLTTVIGDVSGHGIGAALHMVAARSGLRSNVVAGRPFDRVFASLSDQLEQDMEVEHFMTMFMTCFDRESETLKFVNAGHDAPCVYRASSGEIDELPSTGIPLGLFPGSEYEIGEFDRLEPGDVFLGMTDGVWEVNNDAGKMLGKDDLSEAFLDLVNRSETADEIASGILEFVNDYTGGRPPRDDVTLLVIKARG